MLTEEVGELVGLGVIAIVGLEVGELVGWCKKMEILMLESGKRKEKDSLSKCIKSTYVCCWSSGCYCSYSHFCKSIAIDGIYSNWQRSPII